GALRQLAEDRSIPALAVRRIVGGRFSVLSPVGLLPAAVTGVEVEEVLEGAGAMARRCEELELRRNPAGLLAVLLHAADQDLGRPMHVFMPYSDRLRAFALWFQQLWAESLGKREESGDGRGPGVGPTPLAALGAVDQHSLLQLLMDGPGDKLVAFLRVRSRHGHVTIPPTHEHLPALAYLGGHTLQTLLDTELKATVEALRRAGRPSLLLEVEELDARTMGELFMLFQVATVLAGGLYGVDPLDQPGVELGKELTSGLLGREGYPSPELAEDEEWVL
ncbi:MAG: glucose-6-phosphate isomerase, partial [Gemmatimonadota bacterium]